jgi:1,4-dihydroxy-2-naphthoyl-CoA hydrolase
MPSNQFNFSFTVALHDIDAAGIIFFAHLFRRAHDAFEAFTGHIGIDMPTILEQGHYGLPVVHSEADYFKPIRYGDKLRVTAEVAALGHASFTMAYGFLNEAGDPVARVRIVHVVLDREKGKSMAIPEELRAKLAGYLAG